MPAFFINPMNEEHVELLNRLDEQNQDLRVFVSDKIIPSGAVQVYDKS